MYGTPVLTCWSLLLCIQWSQVNLHLLHRSVLRLLHLLHHLLDEPHVVCTQQTVATPRDLHGLVWVYWEVFHPA